MEPIAFISTKFNRPRVVRDLVERPRLVEKLDSGLDRKLTLVAAPAGYGKTTLVNQWLDHSERPVAWLSLDEHDNDLALYLDYFIAAIRTCHPQAAVETEALSKAGRLPPVEYISTTLINDIALLPEPFILVLDDYHVVADPIIHDLMDRLIRYLPAKLHLVLCCRIDPPLPLPLLRGRQQINELRVNNLRFTTEEAQEFLEQAMGRPVDGTFTDLMERRTEGWATGLRLAALSLRDSRDFQASLAHFGEEMNTMLTDYLMEEVLAKQSPSHRRFLIRTSILERFSAPLCDALVAGDNVSQAENGISSQDVILSLEQAGIFITALDDQGQWYRYHDLFRELLRQHFHSRLSPDEQSEVYRRVSAWYAAQGHVDQALEYALAGGDGEGAVHLVEQHRIPAMNRADWRTLERWLGMLPETVVQSKPSLLVTQGLVFGTTKVNWSPLPVLEKAEYLLEADVTLTEEIRTELHAEINTLLASRLFFTGAYEQTLALARFALQHLSSTHIYLRGIALAFSCLAQQMLGSLSEALQQAENASSDPTESYPLRVQAYIALCFIYLTTGDLQQMRQTAADLRWLGEHHDFPLATTWADYFSGVAHYEWNELEKAVAFFDRVFRSRYLATSLTVHIAMVSLTKSYLAAGRLDQAQATIDDWLEYILETGNVSPPPEIDLLRASVLFRQNQIKSENRLGLPLQSSQLPAPLFYYEDRDLMLLTNLLVHEEQADWRMVSNQLRTMLQKAEQGHSALRCIQVRAHLALALSRQGRIEDSLNELQVALSLGQAGGFVRTFVDLGAGMAELIRQSVALLPADATVTDYAIQILNAFPYAPATLDPVGMAWQQSRVIMTEPLTRRETEVLVLLSQNLSYKEIAAQLVITLNTVKKHASHVYAKLGVNNRADALKKAMLLQVL